MIFVGLASSVNLADVAQADHVLGEVAPVVSAHSGLAHHEGLEASPRNSCSTVAVGK